MTMRAVRMYEVGAADVLRVDEIDRPEPGSGEVLVDVAIVGVNFFDVQQRRGNIPATLPHVLGREGVGWISEVGDGVDASLVGRRVGWVEGPASYAEAAVAPADKVAFVPDGIDDETACALMLQGMTAHLLSHDTYPLGPNDTALVYAAAGGVGRLLVQLARLRGARVLACTSTAEKAALVTPFTDDVILYRDVDLAEAVDELTQGKGVDVVYDSIGADTFAASMTSLRPRGMLVLYGASSGRVPPYDLQSLAAKSLFVTRPSLGHYVAGRQQLQTRADALFGHVQAGRLDVQVFRTYPLDDAAQAQADLESGTTVGKLLLRP